MVLVGPVVPASALVLLASTPMLVPARADSSFPFGMEMQLDAAPLPGSKRIPNLDIGDSGATVPELWCKDGKGQFSVAGNTVVFVAGADARTAPARRIELRPTIS